MLLFSFLYTYLLIFFDTFIEENADILHEILDEKEKIIKAIMERGLDPVIIFSFSKKDVESYAKSICTKYDLATKIEK